jgi:very-short-patch-repair endonuclease
MASLLTERARARRRAMTLAERRLWALLRGHRSGVKFRRQEPVDPWIAGFLSHGAKLVVEVESDPPASPPGPLERARRDMFARRGFRMLRVTEAEVLGDPEGVWRVILSALARSG